MKIGAETMWRVVYIAHTSQNADTVEALLREEGFLVQRQPLDALIAGSGSFELRVLKSEAEEARNVLSEHGL